MLKRTIFALVFCIAFVSVAFTLAETLTLPLDRRPAWVYEEGIVMAGSWEPLLFRVRRDGSPGYEPTAEQLAAYEREHSPEMVEKLKDLGVNFVMMHCYKGFGLQAEKQSMADAVRFAKLCHDAGLHVGVYTYSGAFGWELFFKEMPQAKDWVVLDANGNPRRYGGVTYRYYWNRNHPDAQAFYRNIIRFAVEEIKADLLHFDNYSVGPGSDHNSVSRFRRYLKETYTPEQLTLMGVDELERVRPPMNPAPRNVLRFAWLEFSCKSLTDSYYEMSRYARGLRSDILIECNPGGVRDSIRPPIDHGRLLAGGEAFWDESPSPGFRNGELHTRIRTYKVARLMNNMAFTYTTTPLELAESMAFNLDCLGCVCWFEYADLVARPGSDLPVSSDLAPFIDFFRARRRMFQGAQVIADVAILRNFASQVFADPKHRRLTARVEQAMIENCIPFQIIFDKQLDSLERYRCLVLAGCVALSDEQIEKIEDFAESGGRVCVIGPAAVYTPWMKQRSEPGLSGLPAERVVRVRENDDFIDAILRACGGDLSLRVHAPKGICAELTQQSGRRLVHLVNYRTERPAENVMVRVAVPNGKKVERIILASPGRETDIEIPFKQESQHAMFFIPEIRTYEIAQVIWG